MLIRIREKIFVMTALCLALLFPGTASVSSAAAKTYTNTIGMEFVRIPAGSFLLDHSENRHILVGKSSDKTPHRPPVRISKPFYLGKYEVTQAQWAAVMGNNPSRYVLGRYRPDAAWFAAVDEEDLPDYIGPANPVEQVSWRDAQEFIRRLNAREGHDKYRLPTEMEWEFAARGGTNTLFFFMKDPEKIWTEAREPLGDHAWFNANSGQTTRHVGQKKPNRYGLYDMYGNVHEWVQDWHGDLPTDREIVDYRGPASGSARVIRGGSYGSDIWECRSGARNTTMRQPTTPEYRSCDIGFRLAFSPEE